MEEEEKKKKKRQSIYAKIEMIDMFDYLKKILATIINVLPWGIMNILETSEWKASVDKMFQQRKKNKEIPNKNFRTKKYNHNKNLSGLDSSTEWRGKRKEWTRR